VAEVVPRHCAPALGLTGLLGDNLGGLLDSRRTLDFEDCTHDSPVLRPRLREGLRTFASTSLGIQASRTFGSPPDVFVLAADFDKPALALLAPAQLGVPGVVHLVGTEPTPDHELQRDFALPV
jgi:hypothetical protein